MFPNVIMRRRDSVSAEHRTTTGRAIVEEKSTDAADIPQHEWTACAWRKHHVPMRKICTREIYYVQNFLRILEMLGNEIVTSL